MDSKELLASGKGLHLVLVSLPDVVNAKKKVSICRLRDRYSYRTAPLKTKMLLIFSIILSAAGSTYSYDTLEVRQDVYVGSYSVIVPKIRARAQQGIAAYGPGFYTSAGGNAYGVVETHRLFKYDPNWGEDNVEVSFNARIAGFHHLGDIDVYNGYVYGVLTDLGYDLDNLERIHIAWFDEDTLEYEDQVGVSSLVSIFPDLDDIGGVAFKDDQFYLVGYYDNDTDTPRIFSGPMDGHNPSALTKSYEIETCYANGLAFKGDYVFISSGQISETEKAYIDIYEYPLPEGEKADRIKRYEYQTGYTHAEGITFNDDELWVAQGTHVLKLENPLPSIPTGVSASKGEYPDKVRVTWNAVSGADVYFIYRNTNGNPETAAKIGQRYSYLPETFDDTDVNEDYHYYWIKAGKAVDGGHYLLSEFSESDFGYPQASSGDANDTFTAYEHANLMEGSSSSSSNSATMLVYWNPGNAAYTYGWGLVRFDVGDIPADSVINSAALKLDCTGHDDTDGGGSDIRVQECGGSWLASSVNWGNKPSPRGSTVTTNSSGTGQWVWQGPSLESIVQGWIDGGNNGLYIYSNTSDGITRFSSSKASFSIRPKLVVTYTTPPLPDLIVWVSINDPGVSCHEAFNGKMSKYETTNAQYCQFLNEALASGDITIGSDNIIYGATGSNSGGDFAGEVYFETYAASINSQISYSDGTFNVRTREGYDMSNHPVVKVSWYGATAFCNYYGYRLPTEWEWQAVADYDGSYTYGCGTTIDFDKANYYDGGYANPLGLFGGPYTTPVNYYETDGRPGPYGYGMNDMAGNVWEWTNSTRDSNRALCGGSWGSSSNYYCTVSGRTSLSLDSVYDGVGFRVCTVSYLTLRICNEITCALRAFIEA